MKRTDIPNLSAEQALDELVFMRFEKALKAAKRKAVAAQAAEDEVFRLLDDMCIDAENIPTDAENADNLKEAITCYLSYGEYSTAGIMRDVRGAYGKSEESTQ